MKTDGGLPNINAEVINLNLSALGKACYNNALTKGFWDLNHRAIEMAHDADFPPEIIEAIKLAFNAKRLMEATSELGEALEAQRKGDSADVKSFMDWWVANPMPANSEDEITIKIWQEEFISRFNAYIKDSREDEMADTLIRVIQNMHGEGIDIDFHVKTKMAYNSLRPRLHGKVNG